MVYRAYCRVLLTVLPRPVSVALALIVATSLTEAATALVLMPLLGVVGLNVGSGGAGSITSSVLRMLNAVALPTTLPVVLTLYVLTVTAHASLSRWQTIALFRVEHGFNAVLRQRLYAAITHASWRKLAVSRVSAYAHLLTDEVNRVGTVTYQTLSLVASVLVTAIYVAIAARVSPVLTALVLAGGTVVLFLRRTTISRAARRGRQVSSVTQRLYVGAVEHVAALRTAKSYGAEQRHIDSMSAVVAEVASAEVDAVRLQAGSRWALDTGAACVFAATLYVGLVRFELTPASVLLLVYVVARTMPRISALQLSGEQIAQFLPSYDAIERAIAELPPDIAAGTRTASVGFDREIRMESVTLVHDRATASGLHTISLEIPFGAMVAIVGPSGGGKSTLADVLSGLLRADSGQMFVDDVALTDETRDAWKAQVSYVDQDTFLFHDTVRANLMWASPSASERDLRESLQMAAGEFVWQLPQGLETVLGDRGHRLSGGERQRLALARALLRRPRLLILDEATSALDPDNEERILDVINRLRGRMTIVMISHRHSALQTADRTYVMVRGRLVESDDCGTLTRSRAPAHAEHRETPSIPTSHS
jgi:ATP-binding cassette subfamily C protein